MAVDTPATIAIIGAGPIGLEAALYARYLGYDVRVYERGLVAESVRRWGHVQMFSPFGLNSSTLGLAALAAQDPGWQRPPSDTMLTGAEFVEHYLLPLSKSDLLDGNIFEQTEVYKIQLDRLPGEEAGDDPQETDDVFRVLLRDAPGHESHLKAEIVIDASGTYGNPNRLGGDDGIAGEREASDRIEYHLPDVLGADRERYAGRHTLLVGGGHSAATSALALSTLASEVPGTTVTWITRRRLETGQPGPIPHIAGDPLIERERLATEANRLAAGSHPAVRHLAETTVERIDFRADGRIEARLVGQHVETVVADRILALIGYRPDSRNHADLQVRDNEVPVASAPNFYILGSKSCGLNSRFLIADGLAQIRELFGVIGGRATLDLYQDVQRLI